MKRLALIFWAVIAFSSYSTFANDGQPSEQRVLLSFDNSGHHVRQIIHSEAQVLQAEPTPLLETELNYLQAAVADLVPGQAMLLWQDDEGGWYPRSQVPDPRVSHAPAHIFGAENSQVGDVSGAWLVSGSGRASRLIILLPRNTALGLAFEQWDVALN